MEQPRQSLLVTYLSSDLSKVLSGASLSSHVKVPIARHNLNLVDSNIHVCTQLFVRYIRVYSKQYYKGHNTYELLSL